MGSGFSNDTCVCKNFNTANDGTKDAKILLDGQLLIGSTALPNVRVGTLTAGAGVAITNGPGTITVGLAGGGTAIDSITTGSGAPPVVPDGAGNVVFAAGPNIAITGNGPGSTVTTGFSGILPVASGGTNTNSLTDHGIMLGSGIGAVTVTNAPLNGELLIGSTGNDPVLAVPTNGNNVSWTTGAGALTANLTGTTNNTIQLGNAGGSLTSAAALTNGQLLIGNTGNAPTASTLTAGPGINITNSAGGITLASYMSAVAGTYNLGISYAGGTFTVCGADGSALSASNPGYVTIPSKANPGRLITITVTANQTFVDDAGASTIAGNSFGTASELWANDMPWFLYAVENDAEDAIAFAITRVPHRGTSPAAANFAKTGSAVADEQSKMFALGNPTITDYDSNPCMRIGAFRMTKTTAAHDWTVTALGNNDGIGRFYDGGNFVMPYAQTGAKGAAGAGTDSNFENNGGTAPTHTTNKIIYNIQESGVVQMYGGFTITASGIGAVDLALSVPYRGDPQSGAITGGSAVHLKSADSKHYYWTPKFYEGLIWDFVRDSTTTLMANTDLATNDKFLFNIVYSCTLDG
jgi:hypothetical protein